MDADWPGAWPAIVVSSHARRYHRAASVLRLHGFSVRWSPAVFVEGINASACRGFNGHRMAMRRAWKIIVEANRSMAVFEDDVSPAENSEAASLTSEMHAFILKYQQQHDVLWLGGLARIGACSTANPFGNGCYPTRLSLPGGRGSIDASATFFTDHAKWFTVGGASMALRCSEFCIEQAGWGTDGIFKAACAREEGKEPPHLIELTKRFHERYCGAMVPPMRCKQPDQLHWSTTPLSGGRHLVQGSTVWVGFFWQERKTIKSLQHNEQNSFTSTVKSSSDEGGNSNSKAVGGGGGHLGVSVSVDEIGPMLPPVEGFDGMLLSQSFIAHWSKVYAKGGDLTKVMRGGGRSSSQPSLAPAITTIAAAPTPAADGGLDDLGFCAVRHELLGYGPCECGCAAGAPYKPLCLPVRKTRCWGAIAVRPTATDDPCTLGDVRASLLGASPHLQEKPGSKPLRAISKLSAPSPFQLSILRPGEAADDIDHTGAASTPLSGDSSIAAMAAASGDFVQAKEYTKLVRRVAREVGRSLDDPSMALNIYNRTGPGSQHVVTLKGANLDAGMSWSEMRTKGSSDLPFMDALDPLITRFLIPHATNRIFGGVEPTLHRIVVARNIHVPHEVFRTRALLWHWDGLSEKGVKLLLYLTEVPDNRSGCMLVMRHRDSRRPFRMARRAVWGGDLRPPSIPRPWMLELLDNGYSPQCITGPAGTLIHFDTNIIHRGSRPDAGLKRDFILIELYPQVKPSTSSSTATTTTTTTTTTAERRHLESSRPDQLGVDVRGAGGTTRRMPMVGFGTANRKSANGPALVKSLIEYFQQGGRLVDTAQMYGNCPEIGQAVRQSGVKRSEVWIVSKINTLHRVNKKGIALNVNSSSGVRRVVEETLTALKFKTLDAMLIHMPWGNSLDELRILWKALISLQSEGLVHHIGVSNFNSKQIEALVEATGVWPSINEIEYHPYVNSQAHELVRWCLKHSVVVIAYGSLGGSANRGKGGGMVSEVANAHQVSTARVLLRWALQKGVVVIPGATSAGHIADNLALLRASPPVLELSESEMGSIDAAGAGSPPKNFRIFKGLCKEDAGAAKCEPSV